ncbi:hypothetical protein [Streptomyces sp. NPDC002547]
MIVLVAASWTAASVVVAVGYGLARAHDRAAAPQADDEAFIARERHRYDQLIASLDLPRSPE